MKPYYEHGGITIYHGDCREILPQLGEVDLCLTDPPYGIGESSRRNATRGKPFGGKPQGRNTRGTAIPPTDYGFYNWDQKPADPEVIDKCVAMSAHCIIWGGNYFGLPPASKWLVWDKVNSGDFADCELAWTNIGGATRLFKHMWNGMLRDSERDVPRVHPTQKPIALMKWCLGFAPDAKTAVDPYMGSGSFLVAAKATGVHAMGIEIEEKYCEIAAKRLAQEVLNFV